MGYHNPQECLENTINTMGTLGPRYTRPCPLMLMSEFRQFWVEAWSVNSCIRWSTLYSYLYRLYQTRLTWKVKRLTCPIPTNKKMWCSCFVLHAPRNQMFVTYAYGLNPKPDKIWVQMGISTNFLLLVAKNKQIGIWKHPFFAGLKTAFSHQASIVSSFAGKASKASLS